MSEQQRDDPSRPKSLFRELVVAWALVGSIATVVVITDPVRESHPEAPPHLTDAATDITCNAPIEEFENAADRAATLDDTDDEAACSSRLPDSARSPAHAFGFRNTPPIGELAARSSPVP